MPDCCYIEIGVPLKTSQTQHCSFVVSVLIALTFSACSKAPPPPAQPPPEVVVQTVVSQTTPLSSELVAELKAFREVELRPRSTGLVIKQTFEPGKNVREGELLFVIDPRSLDEAVIDAQAKLAESEAELAKTRQDLERYKPLLPDNAIPRQTYDQAVATEQQNMAVVQARRAGLSKARIDRSFSEVRSPVSGVIGLQQIEVGGLATAGQSILATVSSLDPVYAYFSISETEYIKFAKKRNAGENTGKKPIELILADGSAYDQPGEIDFADRAMNPGTGTLTLRAKFPNPEHLLRPGMNARVRITYDIAENAIVIPQKAVTEMLGKQFVTIVGADNKAEQRPVTTGARIGEMWLIENGIKSGEHIVVEGLQKAKAGAVVKSVQTQVPATSTAP